ncbi:MAG: M48 family metalloprotease [Deltaproteobacteria bacterium]|nr:M48 family metalloprotease [Candidatus Anaeroferrophillacea bacterium]
MENCQPVTPADAKKTGAALLFILIPAVLLALLATAGCATNPVTGASEIMLFSDDREIAMGRRAHDQVLEQYGRDDNEPLQRYVTAVGERVSENCERRLNYHFTVIDSGDINAFALPGGYVYLTRGILAEFTDEAQLAAVIGHELGHVNARHNMKRLQTALGMNILTAAVGAATGSSAWQQVSGTLLGLVGQKYSRDHEREADALGTRYTARAGYDPRAMSGFLDRLDELHNDDPGLLQALSASHPLTAERVAHTAALAGELERQYPAARRHDQEAFYRAIDGMRYGPGAQAGFIRDGIYWNRYYRLRLTLPENRTSKVVGRGILWRTADNRRQLLLVNGEPATGQPAPAPATLIDGYMKDKKATLRGWDGITLAGGTGQVRRYRADANGRAVNLDVAAVDRRDRWLLVVSLADSGSELDLLGGRLQEVGTAEAAAIEPPRVRIVRLATPASLADIAARELGDAARAAEIADYNRLRQVPEHRPLPADTILKIIADYDATRHGDT